MARKKQARKKTKKKAPRTAKKKRTRKKAPAKKAKGARPAGVSVDRHAIPDGRAPGAAEAEIDLKAFSEKVPAPADDGPAAPSTESIEWPAAAQDSPEDRPAVSKTPPASPRAPEVAEPRRSESDAAPTRDETEDAVGPAGGEPADPGNTDEAVELSTSEALAFFASLRGPQSGDEAAWPPVEPGGGATNGTTAFNRDRQDTLDGKGGPSCQSCPSCPSLLDAVCRNTAATSRIITFESAHVEAWMRVAGSTLARLYGMVCEEGLAVELGRLCQSEGEFLAEWDATPAEVPVVIIANLSFCGEFLDAVVGARPGVASSYWVVFETLRSRVSTQASGFLAELRARNRVRAVGYGPRNLIEAARSGAEAVRGHVEWGFGRPEAASLTAAAS